MLPELFSILVLLLWWLVSNFGSCCGGRCGECFGNCYGKCVFFSMRIRETSVETFLGYIKLLGDYSISYSSHKAFQSRLSKGGVLKAKDLLLTCSDTAWLPAFSVTSGLHSRSTASSKVSQSAYSSPYSVPLILRTIYINWGTAYTQNSLGRWHGSLNCVIVQQIKTQ